MATPISRPIRLCRFDFSVDGGAAGAISPARRVTLPAGTVIESCFVRVITAPTGGAGSTVSVGLSGGDELLGAVDIELLDKEAATPKARVGGSAEFVKVTVSGADLTAGKFDIWGTVISPPST